MVGIKVTAVLLAGGCGSRMGAGKPKQCLTLHGKKIFMITAERFSDFSCVDEFVFVGNAETAAEYEADLKDFPKFKGFVEGGATRTESVFNALKYLKNSGADIVVLHDIVRPFVSAETVENSINSAIETGAAVAAVKTVDTIFEVKDGKVVSVPDREFLYNVQTPQTFKFSLILDAYEKFIHSGKKATDDSAVAIAAGHTVHVVEGGYDNIKITRPEDIPVAENLIGTYFKR